MITSPTNPRVKALVRLQRRREREATGLFLIEGRREVDRAVAAGIEIESVFVAPELGGSAPAGQPVTELAASVFAKASLRENPDGVLAVARHFDASLARLRPPPPALVLVAEGIEKPGNLGAMVRSAAAAGAGAMIVTDPATDVFNPNVVRASQGAVFDLPIAVAAGFETTDWLAYAGIPAYAAVPAGGVPPWQADLALPVAVVVGSEAHGLSPAWAGSEPVTIPMPGAGRGVDSLNAAAAVAILLFEAVRQRSA